MWCHNIISWHYYIAVIKTLLPLIEVIFLVIFVCNSGLFTGGSSYRVPALHPSHITSLNRYPLGPPDISFFFLNFCWTHVHFWGHWNPCFGLLVTSSLGFEVRLGILIWTLWRHTWYMFPEIHLWCDTSAGVYGQHSSRSLSPHVCFSRDRMLDSNHRPPAWIHLWCDTSASVYSQHSSWSISPHTSFSRGRMLDLNHRPPAWQSDALSTRPQRLEMFKLV